MASGEHDVFAVIRGGPHLTYESHFLAEFLLERSPAQHMKVLTEQVIAKPNTHKTRAADGLWLFVRPVGFMAGMGVDGLSMAMDLQRIIAKFGRSESIASHTTEKSHSNRDAAFRAY
jgi:hypothetical protein